VGATPSAQNAGRDRELLATELPELAELLIVENLQCRPHASIGYKPPAPEVFVPAFAAGRLRYADRLLRPRWRNGQP
jgi:hypothetical protein